MRNPTVARILVVGTLTAVSITATFLVTSRKPQVVSAAWTGFDASTTGPAPYSLRYSESGDLVPPLQYREWIYVTTGLGMSYDPKPTDGMSMSMPKFDNVFVNPEAYRSFVATGTWPDKTVIVLEGRMAASKGSINQSGHFQSGGIQGLELHVKDENRFPDKWAFFDVETETKATLIPSAASCYSCHTAHAAVDTTFVQFYPTLLPIAQKKNTLSANYLKETSSTTTK